MTKPTPKPELKPAPKPDRPDWTEPADPAVARVAEPDFGQDVEAKYLPDWAKAEIPTKLPGKTVSVQRITDPRDAEQKSTLHGALEVIGVGTIELADDGPFFETGFRTPPEARLIRARNGFRPIVALERPKPAEVEAREAFFDVGDKSLILDGLDLVVDVIELPRTVTTLFACRGGSLTLKNCTITIINSRQGQSLSLVRSGPSERPSKIRLERTFVRGAINTVFDLSGGPAEVVLNRSVVLNAAGSGIAAGRDVAGERSVSLVRSVVATRASAIELGEPKAGKDPRPLAMRALGSTFARFQSPSRVSLFATRCEAGAPPDFLAWQGDYNTFIGWSGWLSTAQERNVPISHMEDARGVWPGTDTHSKTSLTGWARRNFARDDDSRELA